MKCIVNGKILLENQILENKVLVFGKKIVDITDEVVDGYEIIDANGKYVSPGLVDIHIHGNVGKDVMDGNEEAISDISKSIVRHGVTSFLPTTMTMGKDSIDKALQAIRKSMNKNIEGAKPIGVHLEGPFINEAYKGAQNPEFIIDASYDFIKDNADIIKVITYAPEKDTNLEFTKDIKKNTNIVLSIGHSKATYEQAKEAINLGASNITHLFNGMTGLNHRNPGVVGAALTSNDAYCEIIADTIHIKKDLFQFILDNKGKEKVILITDSIEAGGLEDGEYSLGGQKVIVKENQARLESGSLAGSVMPLNIMINNFYKNTNLKINEAINLASLNAARSIHVDNTKGSIQIGKDADIAIFDEDLNCFMTIVNGEILYKR
ncbi:N-acetylglucosamine-6-phosphate deacetylase [Romboutsia weinsteinii]|uniref:N-acetylglucosamine-6-phosphate deacetylase n=1 Tax=Romboutsia weinsteinii TaxID=2020949 RepID=A0A371IZG6_9FIRM|nr:N-acetylglucosamine-6-phosphate deacetylase [Romboutsia weinsteinii]RDY25864.1 N-acetylglucosamine-6-phosphate deacetylase [Romboutsia weinsteinii]